jgi:predicted nucleic acid-binding protein
LVLVDTTVWIDLLRGADKPTVAMLRQLLGEGRTLTTPVVVQEILQGASSPASVQRLRAHFLALPMIEPRPGGATHAAAGELYARCRWQGVTPRSPHDFLIAQMAIDHDVELLHDDRDFQALAAVDRRLRLVPATGS